MTLNQTLLHAANDWVGRSEAAFFQALSLSDRASWVMAACVIVSMWFTGDADSTPMQPGRLRRRECRRRVLLMAAALPLAFVLAQVVQKLYYVPRPLFDVALVVPINGAVWATVKSAFNHHSSFPSDHAVLFAVVATGLWSINRFAGLVAALMGLYFSTLRVGLGFHWPGDIAAGAVVGIFVTLLLLRLKPRVLALLDFTIDQFDLRQAFSYPVAFLLLLDLTQKFSTLFYLASTLLGRRIEH